MVDPVQHHTAGSFEELPSRFEARQVHNFVHMETPVGRKRLDDVQPPFGPARDRLHRVEKHPSVRVGSDPVVRKHRVRLDRLVGVLEDQRRDAGLAERADHAVELGDGLSPQFRETLFGRPLERIRRGRLHVWGEAVRANHECVPSCLAFCCHATIVMVLTSTECARDEAGIRFPTDPDPRAFRLMITAEIGSDPASASRACGARRPDGPAGARDSLLLSMVSQ